MTNLLVGLRTPRVRNTAKKIGNATYRRELPKDAHIHPIFHVSQLKPFVQAYSPVFSNLRAEAMCEVAMAVPKEILERHPVKNGNAAGPYLRRCGGCGRTGPPKIEGALAT